MNIQTNSQHQQSFGNASQNQPRVPAQGASPGCQPRVPAALHAHVQPGDCDQKSEAGIGQQRRGGNAEKSPDRAPILSRCTAYYKQGPSNVCAAMHGAAQLTPATCGNQPAPSKRQMDKPTLKCPCIKGPAHTTPHQTSLTARYGKDIRHERPPEPTIQQEDRTNRSVQRGNAERRLLRGHCGAQEQQPDRCRLPLRRQALSTRERQQLPEIVNALNAPK